MNILKIFVLGCALLAAGVLGWWVGFKKASQNAVLAEAKILHAALSEAKRQRAPDAVFRQIVVARYYLSLSRIDGSWRAGLVEDFGPLDKTVLNGVPIDKGPIDLEELHLQVVPHGQ